MHSSRGRGSEQRCGITLSTRRSPLRLICIVLGLGADFGDLDYRPFIIHSTSPGSWFKAMKTMSHRQQQRAPLAVAARARIGPLCCNSTRLTPALRLSSGRDVLLALPPLHRPLAVGSSYRRAALQPLTTTRSAAASSTSRQEPDSSHVSSQPWVAPPPTHHGWRNQILGPSHRGHMTAWEDSHPPKNTLDS